MATAARLLTHHQAGPRTACCPVRMTQMRTRLSNVVQNAAEGGQECSGTAELSTLRKNFKPASKPKGFGTPTRATATKQVMNGRDKREVLETTGTEVASMLSKVEEWKRVDDKVNKYPTKRLFTAVGAGEEDFKLSMVKAVESATGEPVPPESVQVVPSSGGKYWSVRVGPVTVTSGDQVLEIFTNMRQDKRLKFHM